MADAAIKRSSPDGLALSSLPGAVVTGAGLVPPISSARVAVCLCARQAGASDQRNERNTWGGTGWPMTADKRLPGPFTPPSQACVRRAAVLGGGPPDKGLFRRWLQPSPLGGVVPSSPSARGESKPSTIWLQFSSHAREVRLFLGDTFW